MIVNSVNIGQDGQVHVMLANKTGVSFANIDAVRQTAQNAIKRIGTDGAIAIALMRAARARDIVGVDLATIIQVES